MVLVVLTLHLGANAYYAAVLLTDTSGYASPWLWMVVAAFLVMLSHAWDGRIPPRVTETKRWYTHRQYIHGVEGQSRRAGAKLRRTARLLAQAVSGCVNEWWASPRLMPYNFLFLMFRWGYRPDDAARLRNHAARAVASGNPALDYVGVGGGAYLRER